LVKQRIASSSERNRFVASGKNLSEIRLPGAPGEAAMGLTMSERKAVVRQTAARYRRATKKDRADCSLRWSR
jgi:hypothetical protein